MYYKQMHKIETFTDFISFVFLYKTLIYIQKKDYIISDMSHLLQYHYNDFGTTSNSPHNKDPS